MSGELKITPRGACPTLAAPMSVGDGLLARFHPEGGGFAPGQLSALADASQRYGNDRVEITARGSVQVRGLSPETSEPFREALDAAGIAAQTGVEIAISPIAGRDPMERRDPRSLAEVLKAVTRTALARGKLSPKLSIVIDGGGQIGLSELKADIRLVALPEGWLLIAGDVPAALVEENEAPNVVANLLTALQAIGLRARATDLTIPPMVVPPPLLASNDDNAGPLTLADNAIALRAALPFGQADAAQLQALVRAMMDFGITAARPAPARSLILDGFAAADLDAFTRAVSAAGFRTRPEPGALTLCSGVEAGLQGLIHNADLARAFTAIAPDLLDGSFHLHVSTCVKGCAFAARPGLVLEGAHLALHRAASQKPLATLDPQAIEGSIAQLAGRIREKSRPGETTLGCLTRLGTS